jgi:alpha-beta hydrolase superfamily lysophospholipase
MLLKALLRAGVKDVELIVYHEARHEVFNEINKEEVLTDLIDWLESEFTPLV